MKANSNGHKEIVEILSKQEGIDFTIENIF